MKKILWIAFLLIMCSEAHSQEFILRTSTGISLSKFSGDDFYKETNSRFPAPFLKVSLERQISKHFSLNLGAEYSLKGTNYDRNVSINDSNSYINYYGFTRLHYLVFPLGVTVYSKRLVLSYELYTGVKMGGYSESLSETFDNGDIVSQTIASGKLRNEVYNKPLFGHEIGIGYKMNENIIKLSFIKDILTIDNLNSSRMLNSTFRLSYSIIINYQKAYYVN